MLLSNIQKSFKNIFRKNNVEVKYVQYTQDPIQMLIDNNLLTQVVDLCNNCFQQNVSAEEFTSSYLYNTTTVALAIVNDVVVGFIASIGYTKRLDNISIEYNSQINGIFFHCVDKNFRKLGIGYTLLNGIVKSNDFRGKENLLPIDYQNGSIIFYYSKNLTMMNKVMIQNNLVVDSSITNKLFDEYCNYFGKQNTIKGENHLVTSNDLFIDNNYFIATRF
jgi:hypothetical protein